MTVWISLRKATCVVGLGAIYALGCYSGCHFSKDKEYNVNRDGDKTTLKSESLGKEYQLRKINNELYLGSSAHNFKGAMEVAKLEGIEKGKESMTPKVRQLEEENKSLRTEVVRNKVVNGIENVEDKVKNSWKDMKKGIRGE